MGVAFQIIWTPRHSRTSGNATTDPTWLWCTFIHSCSNVQNVLFVSVVISLCRGQDMDAKNFTKLMWTKFSTWLCVHRIDQAVRRSLSFRGCGFLRNDCWSDLKLIFTETAHFVCHTSDWARTHSLSIGAWTLHVRCYTIGHALFICS